MEGPRASSLSLPRGGSSARSPDPRLERRRRRRKPRDPVGLRLTFRATAHSRPLARAVAAPGACGVVSFAIRGHPKPDLRGWTFVDDVGARLGIKLTPLTRHR